MPEKKRYTATIDFYIWAESDEKAIAKAKKFAKKQEAKKDNQCRVQSVDKTPFASLLSTNIFSLN